MLVKDSVVVSGSVSGAVSGVPIFCRDKASPLSELLVPRSRSLLSLLSLYIVLLLKRLLSLSPIVLIFLRLSGVGSGIGISSSFKLLI